MTRTSRTAEQRPAIRAVAGFDAGTEPSPLVEAAHAKPPRAARLVIRLMQEMREGSLTVRFPDGTTHHFGHGLPHGQIALANWNVCQAALKSGDIGFGETYIAGDWTTPDLLTLMHVMVINRNAIEAVIYGTWWGRVAYRLRHLLRRNTRSGSRKNIHAHYDIGNDFYRLWLDASMTYSSALFADDRETVDLSPRDDLARLADAQEAKYARVLDQLALAPDASVLEIGCGWGGFARRAAHRGLHVDGVTLSAEQLDWALRHDEAVTGASKVRLSISDYRDLQGRYDGIASIEMFEAVGERYWADYFACIARCLKPGGRAVVQTITIDETLFPAYRKSSDFIQQYIFPGGMLPSVSAFRQAAESAGLEVVDAFAFGKDYARTLAAWHERFVEQQREVHVMGFDAPFVRTWSFYLAYCAAAFRSGNTDVFQFTLGHRATGRTGARKALC